MERDGWTLGRRLRYGLGVVLMAFGGLDILGALVAIYATFFATDSSYDGQRLTILGACVGLMAFSLFLLWLGARLAAGAKPARVFYDATIPTPPSDARPAQDASSLDMEVPDEVIAAKLGNKKETPGIPGLPKIKKKDSVDDWDGLA